MFRKKDSLFGKRMGKQMLHCKRDCGLYLGIAIITLLDTDVRC